MSIDNQRGRRAQKRRSRAGLLIAIFLLPLLLGVLACIPPLPVPLGDPENSAIDPALSGAWVLGENGGATMDNGLQVMVLDPYDRRTWLLYFITLEPVGVPPAEAELSPEPDSAPAAETFFDTLTASQATAETEPAAEATSESQSAPEVASETLPNPVTEDLPQAAATEAVVRMSAIERLRAGQLEVRDISVWKSWLTTIEGETFITWEPKTLSETLPSMAPDKWWAMRVRLESADIVHFDFFWNEDDSYEEATTQQELKDNIRRNMNNPAFFLNDPDGEEFTLEFHKLTESDLAELSLLLDIFGVEDNFLDG
jgi:hypothetical protein